MTHEVQFPGLGLTFTVNEVAFSFGDFQVRWYGIIIAVGFLLAILYASRYSKKMNIDMNRLIDAVIVGLIGSVICARLYYVLFYPNGDYYWEDPVRILRIHDGGLAIYGGLIGAVVFGGITAKIRKLKVPAVLDLTALGFLIGQSVGRWGNFVNQEAFGTLTDLPWAMYSDNTNAVTGGAVHPCFLYESLLCLLGFILLHFFNLKLRRYDGQTFLLYIIWYGASRFFIEGLRTDSLMIPYLNLRVSQVLAAVCVLAGVILLVVFRRKTSLTGCGSRKVMEGIGLAEAPVSPEAKTSTIFEDPDSFEETLETGKLEEEKPEPEQVSEEAEAAPVSQGDTEAEKEE